MITKSHLEMSEQAKGIAIIIDRRPVFAPATPMTGQALKQLGGVDPTFDLFLITPGPEADRLVGDDESVDLKPGTRFVSAPRDLNPGSGSDAA